MNTNTLKKFAQETRRKLMQQVAAKLEFVTNNDTPELREKAEQVRKLKEEIKAIGKEQVVDKVAYTWFNRFMALRFMDANDYQPLGVRVLSPLPGQTTPEILNQAKQGDIPAELKLKPQKILDLLDGRTPSSNPQNEAYKELLIASCNHLHAVLPFLFERINDYTELLLPDDLTSEFSIVYDVVQGMTEADCQEVEIIGWLYQFYISEKKDEVFASKSAVKKEDIPAATQLFTPRWIVEYMVQNTVGKLWLQNKPNSKLREHMPYFIESPSVTNEDYLKLNSIEELTLLDQACGSGHILVYGFDLLYKIYEEEGYNTTEIPELIIKNNLFGFEIDERASQLAGMALMMKARSYNRRFFRKEVEPTILCYKDLVLSKDEYTEAFKQIGIKLTDELNYDLTQMQQATNYGSLIAPNTSTQELEKLLAGIIAKENTSDAFLKYQLEQLKITVEQLILLSHKYRCIVDNPPYMGGGKMNNILGDFVKKNYPDSKADLMTCFMEAGWNMLLPKGVLGMINLPSWLFLSSFEKLREVLINKKNIDSLLHMGRGIFGVDWGSTAFIIQNQRLDKDSNYFKLHKRNFQHIHPEDIEKLFLKAKNDPSIKINFDKYREEGRITSINDLLDKNGLQISYTANQKDFLKIPGNSIGYWLNKKSINLFTKDKIKDSTFLFQGMITGNNEKFLRFWGEVNRKAFDNCLESFKELNDSKYWVPYNKGGEAKKWYGNLDLVVNFSNKGSDLTRARLKFEKYFFKPCFSWNYISSSSPMSRFYPQGTIWDVHGSSGFNIDVSHLKYSVALINSSVGKHILDVINPTISIQVENIGNIPRVESGKLNLKLVDLSIEISREDWDTRETSWDYIKNELKRIKGQDLEEVYDLYQQYWKNKFFQLHKNEEELNRQFIEIYGLQDELTPDVPLEDITILKEETVIQNGQLVFKESEVFAQFMSYAVGCMFGRYSLDKEGLILANQGETLEDYLAKVEKTKDQLSFTPDDDNIIPVLDDEWFEDDITGRFYAFLKAIFGSANFDKNLAFVEECLGKDIRKYFIKDFYNDHIKRYKKRPIYWMFSSPKGSFNVLIYMHRYTSDTLSNILNNYLREFIEKLKIRKEHLEQIKVSGSAPEQSKAIKEIDKLDKMLLDCQEYEREILYKMATERIAIDLDDGVLVNYNKFGKAVKLVKGLNDKKAKDKVKKFDWIDVNEIR